MSAQSKTPAHRDQQGANKTWQQREKDKVKTHHGCRDWQNLSKTALSSSCRSSSSSSWSSSSSSSSFSSSSSSSSSKSGSSFSMPGTGHKSSWLRTPPSQSSHWPSHGNSSNSPMSHKFSGMGMRDVLNVTLAQEMAGLGMGSCKPLDMRDRGRQGK